MIFRECVHHLLHRNMLQQKEETDPNKYKERTHENDRDGIGAIGSLLDHDACYGVLIKIKFLKLL